MCFSSPNAPKPIPPPQAAKLPDFGNIQARIADVTKRRMGMAASILTGPQTLGAPSTTASPVLGRTGG